MYIQEISAGTDTELGLDVKYGVTAFVVVDNYLTVTYDVNVMSPTNKVVTTVRQENKVVEGTDYTSFMASTLKQDIDTYITSKLPLYT